MTDPRVIDPRVTDAARNNALWCDLVCRSHGIPTELEPDLWRSLRRSPPFYPDAVTLGAALTAAEVAERLDGREACSVKDSLAALDLRPAGFRVLFAAEWIHRSPGSPGAAAQAGWEAVGTAAQLREWGRAHGGGDVFRPALLGDPAVTVLARRSGGSVVAGAVANLSATDAGDPVVGVSNVFAGPEGLDRTWSGLAGELASRFPGHALVGYESGAELAAARRAGFATLGPLRVWARG